MAPVTYIRVGPNLNRTNNDILELGQI